MALPTLATTVVGSYPQPDWLVDRALLSKGVPRVRMRGLWRVPEPWLEQAQDDATIVAIRDMERAGIVLVLGITGMHEILLRRLERKVAAYRQF